MTKSAAKVSKEDSRRPPCKPYPVSATPTNALRALVNSRGVHELVAGSSAWRVRAARGGKAKIGRFAVLRDCILPTRANILHEKAKQIRARHCSHARPKQEPMLSFLHKYAKAHSTFALSA